ncbi:helix-turn-helix domain-containing protein [Sporomusa aerivorans]|uniref:helix-turn-helix domain-containing protein n=1 Tax=Sporomusa aerivorans TaxID=204936 RepID=UPI00352B073C
MLLKELMEKKHYSQYRLSIESGVSQAQISRILSGQQPRLPTLQKLADGLKVSVSDLIGDKPKKLPKTG